MKVKDCLAIAGIAYRRLSAINKEIAKSETAFPKGPDFVDLSQEAAMCESVIAIARAFLSNCLLELSFNAQGRGMASPPDGLGGTRYDNGVHKEPLKRRRGSR